MVRPGGSSVLGQGPVVRPSEPAQGHSEAKPTSSDAPVATAGAQPTPATAETAKARIQHDLAAQQLRTSLVAKAESDAPVEPPRKAFQAGHLAGRLVYEHGRGSLDLAYAQATRLAARGQQLRPGGNLSVRHQGRTIEYSDVQYQPSSTGYSAAFRVRDGDTDMRYEMSERSGRFTARGRGTLEQDGESYRVDLRYRGTIERQLDTSGNASAEQYSVTGSVRTDGWTLELDETYQFRSETGNVRTVGHGTACTVQRTINNTLSKDDATFRWQGVHTRSAFRSSRGGGLAASSPTEWSARGNVTRNGQPFGEYRLEHADGQLQIYLKTPTESISVDKYRLPR